jgi:hypothetical protein
MNIDYSKYFNVLLLLVSTDVFKFCHYDINETWSLTQREEHENRVLRRIFGPKREEVVRGWRRLHNGEHHNLHASPNIKVIRSRSMILAESVACKKLKIHTKFWSENMKGRYNVEDLGIDGYVISE